MSETTPVLLTLVVYNALLIAVGLWAKGRNRNVADFYIAGRGLGPWVASISACASNSSAWTMLGVSGVAYAWGPVALWLFPATISGFLINWIWVAPRLQSLARDEDSITLSSVVAPASLGESRRVILRLAAVIIVFCFVFYVASQFEAAGKAFESTFTLPKQTSILVGAGIVLAYTLLGGFWAVSITDTVQGLLMVFAAIILPGVSLIAVGGIDALILGLNEMGNSGSPTASLSAGMTIFFVLGIFGVTPGYPGQPHVVNRFMALRDDMSLRQGRVIAVTWAVLVFGGMLILGLSARVFFADLADSEQVVFKVAGELLPPVFAGVMLAAVLSAIMSTADSQLLVAASAVSYDWSLADGKIESGLSKSRITVIVVLIMATILALVWRADIFSRVLFAWTSLGAAFGPILILRLLGRSISAKGTLAAMSAGFGLTVLLSWFPTTPGDVAERFVPFVIALAIAAGTSRAR